MLSRTSSVIYLLPLLELCLFTGQ